MSIAGHGEEMASDWRGEGRWLEGCQRCSSVDDGDVVLSAKPTKRKSTKGTPTKTVKMSPQLVRSMARRYVWSQQVC
uniref:Uncharacterized protein n=1 Tax=Oryza rufipogon TaxID=4529 RepID=A0A0E0N5C3_ORYRU